MPFGIGFGGPIEVRTRHSEIIDPLRSGLPPEGSCGDADRGSSLMLMPAAVLVVMVLGAIAVDQSIVYTRQRELVAAAEAAANDAAGYGLDRDAFYDRNEVVFDLARARAAALAALRARRIDALAGCRSSPEVPRSRCSLRAEVEYVFAGAIPGAPGTTEVRAQRLGRAATSLASFS